MAFYSRKINDIGEEIERPKSSSEFDSRSYQLLNTSSDRESLVSRQVSSTGGIYSRYINPALCITKGDTSSESLSDVVPSLNSDPAPSITSDPTPSIVPPLDLNSSGETMPSTDSAPNVSYTVQKTCEANKISQSNAFYNWLSGKKRIKSIEEARQKELQEERQRQSEERKKQAEEEYQIWLAKKAAPKEKPSTPTSPLQEYQKVSHTREDNESNRKAWEQKKLDEQRRKRMEIQRAKEQQKVLEERRREQAERAWRSWIAEAPLKPKPVPLNQGFLTLKGTISDIYVNPNPWHEPFDPDGVKVD